MDNSSRFIEGTILPMLTTSGAECEMLPRMVPTLAFFLEILMVVFEGCLGTMCCVGEAMDCWLER
jgi:hypothetical protein